MDTAERGIRDTLNSILDELKEMRKDQQTYYQKWDEFTQDTRKELDESRAMRTQMRRLTSAQASMAETIQPGDIRQLAESLKDIPNKEKLAEYAAAFLKDKHREDEEFKNTINKYNKDKRE